VDPAKIDASISALPGSSANMPLVLSVVLMHEILHIPLASTGASSSDCIEIPHQVAVAAENCDLAAYIASEGLDPSNLCAFYNTIKNSINGPNTANAWAAAGCGAGGTPQPTIPPCPTCGP
jgi:hypothetical protein